LPNTAIILLIQVLSIDVKLCGTVVIGFTHI